jgi:hypothetical protein
MVQIISVDPVPGGWSVKNPFAETPMFFLSGAKAERKARELGDRIVSCGDSVEVHVHAKGGMLIGRLHFGMHSGGEV